MRAEAKPERRRVGRGHQARHARKRRIEWTASRLGIATTGFGWPFPRGPTGGVASGSKAGAGALHARRGTRQRDEATSTCSDEFPTLSNDPALGPVVLFLASASFALTSSARTLAAMGVSDLVDHLQASIEPCSGSLRSPASDSFSLRASATNGSLANPSVDIRRQMAKTFEVDGSHRRRAENV